MSAPGLADGSDSPPDKGACCFCGSTATLTKEHIWPKWIAGVLPITVKTVPHEVHDLPPWDAPPFSMTVRQVCASCNNGWMNDLETAAKPLLAPMMLGKSITLDDAAQRVVALWAIKTAMMVQFTEKSRSIPTSHYRHVYEHREPPPHTVSICLARYVTITPDGWRVERMAHYTSHKLKMTGSESGNLTHGYGATLSIGQLVLQIVGVYGEHAGWLERTSRNPEFVCGIWPISEPAVTWPPRLALDEAGLDLFGRSFLS